MHRRNVLLGAAAAVANAAAKKRSYPLIDPHTHVWTQNPKYPWAKENANPPATEKNAEMLLELMRQHGVSHTVLVQYIGYRWDNSYTLDCMRKYPREFRGVARVNPADPASPEHTHRLKEQGFHGIRLSPATDASGDWYRGPLMAPLWKSALDTKMPMQILAGPGRMPDTGVWAEKFPDLTVVVDHMADTPVDQPRELDKLIALARYPKVFVKISHSWSLSKEAYPWRDTFAHVKRLYAAFGPQRLMWGTDWPVCESKGSYGQSLSVVRDEMKFLNDEDRSWILSKTVERIWKFT